MTRKEEIKRRMKEIEERKFWINMTTNYLTWEDRKALWKLTAEWTTLNNELKKMEA